MLPQTAALLERIGRRVAELRSGRRLTQEQLAERLDVLPGYLQRIERGAQNVSVESLVKLALALRCDVTDLFATPASRAKRRPGRPKKRE